MFYTQIWSLSNHKNRGIGVGPITKTVFEASTAHTAICIARHNSKVIRTIYKKYYNCISCTLYEGNVAGLHDSLSIANHNNKPIHACEWFTNQPKLLAWHIKEQDILRKGIE